MIFLDERKSSLDNFVVNNDDLELLESKLKKFNPLRILKISEYEIRHSNVVSWLLDPSGTHGFGDKILKKTLSEILVDNEEKERDKEFDVLWVQSKSFHDAIVLREWKNIDILVVSELNKFILLIENKIHAKESEGQLKKYLSIVTEKYRGFKVLPVFMTLNGDAPQEDSPYFIFDYSSFYRILSFSLKLYKNDMNQEAVNFIQQYLNVLGVLTMEDTTIKDLCRKIYSQHKSAIDLIVEQGIGGSYAEAMNTFFTEVGGLEELRRSPSALWFLPKNLTELPKDVHNWQSPYAVCYWFHFGTKEGKLFLLMEIGPVKDYNKRLALINKFRDEGFKFNYKLASRPESKYTRMHRRSIIIDDWTDMEEVAKKMKGLYEKSKDQNLKIQSTIQKFYQGYSDN